jgi:hypothetical protein
MLGKRTFGGTGIAVAGLAIAIAVPTGAASPLAHPATQLRLESRSIAFDGHRSGGTTVAAWRSALALRSDALNRRYHLGKYATR